MASLKHILLIILLSGVCFYSLTPFLFQVRIVGIKMEATERIRENFLQIVHVNKNDVRWIDTGKELRIDGRLFDVDHFKDSGDYLVLTGIFDDEETAWEMALQKICGDRLSKERAVLNKYFQFLLLTNFQPLEYQIYLPLPLSDAYCVTPSSKLNECFIRIPSPPPQAPVAT